MKKVYKILKWIGVTILGLVIILVSFGFWFKGLIPPRDQNLKTTVVNDLAYLSEDIIPKRGKILAVVTSVDKMGTTEKDTGYELSELSRAYYVFTANGFEVDIASTLGGKPPVVIDDEDMGAYDYAFLNDSIAEYKRSNTIPIDQVVSEDYDAIFFAGGKGAMYDFPDNPHIQSIVSNYYQSNKVVGAVCHGPAALVNVTLNNGESLLKGKEVSGFTNDEELLLISDAKTIFPFLLQDKIEAQGANFEEGVMYLENVSQSDNLITGQNPWSTWMLAETMIRQMGYTPKYRQITDEEYAVQVLLVYHKEGKQKAKEKIKTLTVSKQKPVNRVLIAKHSILAAMKGEIGNFYNLLNLVSYAKKCEAKTNKI